MGCGRVWCDEANPALLFSEGFLYRDFYLRSKKKKKEICRKNEACGSQDAVLRWLCAALTESLGIGAFDEGATIDQCTRVQLGLSPQWYEAAHVASFRPKAKKKKSNVLSERCFVAFNLSLLWNASFKPFFFSFVFGETQQL